MPLMVEQLVDVLRLLDALIPVAEQVIDVPKIFVERIPSRTSVREPQLAELLVEVPTIISYSSLCENAEQNVDIPVPHGRDGGEVLLGLHPGQSSTAFSGADHRSVTAEQIVDIPAPRGGRVLHPASSSSGLQGKGFFALFPKIKKSAKLGPHPSPKVPASVSSSTLAAQPVSDSWWASLTPAQQAELEVARAEVRREHVSKRKRKKKSKRKLPRVSSCGYKFLPLSRRLLGMISTLSLRDGGPWLLRSILAASCPHGCLQAASWSVWTRRTFMLPHSDQVRCSRCTDLDTWTVHEPLVSGSYLFGARLA